MTANRRKRLTLLGLVAGIVLAFGALAIFALALFGALGTRGSRQPTPGAQVAIRSRATLQARLLPTSTWTPGPSPTRGDGTEPAASAALPGDTPAASPPIASPAAGTPTQPPPSSPAASASPGPSPTLAPQTTALPTSAPSAAASATSPPGSTPSSTPASSATASTTPQSSASPTATPTRTYTPTPRPPRLAFASDRDGDYEIYTMKDDGSDLVQLTFDPAEDSRPSWSPDGARIAFDSDRSGNYDIYIMNADGAGLVQLTDHASQDVFPVWSPDGARLAFVSLRDEPDPENCDPCNWEIYVMQANGSGQTNLTQHLDEDFSPAWSPDGGRIAFDSNRDGSYNIHVMNSDGSGVTNLTKDPGGNGNPAWSNVNPAWSPDGARIAFTTLRHEPDPYTCDPCNWELYTMRADGSLPSRLTTNDADDDHPAWSPDGARIAFVSWRDGNAEVYVMQANGGGPINLTNDPGAYDWDAVWAPW